MNQRDFLFNCRYVTVFFFKKSAGGQALIDSSPSGFPNVIGAIDCTHVRIQAPSGPVEADYVNRKSFHSLNVQVCLCTSRGQLSIHLRVKNVLNRLDEMCPSTIELIIYFYRHA